MGSRRVMYPEIGKNGLIKFIQKNSGKEYSDDEKPHYMDLIKRSMTYAKGDVRSPKWTRANGPPDSGLPIPFELQDTASPAKRETSRDYTPELEGPQPPLLQYPPHVIKEALEVH